MLLSIVLPIYNEQDVIEISIQRLKPILENLDYEYEVVFVDDGSTDRTVELLSKVINEWHETRLIRLRSNRGQLAAITAGLEFSKGDFVVTIDIDFQDPPELIPRMVEIAQKDNLDVVYGVRTKRTSDTFFKRTTAKIYYPMMRKLLGNHIYEGAAEFRLMSRAVVTELLNLPEINKVYRHLVPWLGYRSGSVEFEREARLAGKTHYSLLGMARLAFDSLSSFSAAPLRVATWLGGIGILVGFFLATYSLVEHLSGNTTSGWTSLVIIEVFFGATQLLCIGLIGEYVGRLYSEIQHRPVYFAFEQKRLGRQPDSEA